MANFSMTCTCGDTLTVDAPDRDTAVNQLKGMMDQDGIDRHIRERHNPSDPKPTVEQVHAMIEQTLVAA
jgi:hypothetical protein